MFGNNGLQFQPVDWQQLALTAGLSMLGNNNGSKSFGQLVGNAGLDALAGLQARKQYEAAMARQQAQDDMERQKHELTMKQGQAELAETERLNGFKARYAAGDRSPEVMNALFGKELLAHEHRMEELGARAEEDRRAADIKFGRDKTLAEIRSRQSGGSSGYIPVDEAARKELAKIARLDSMTNTLEDAVAKAYPNGGKSAGGTGLVEGILPNTFVNRVDPNGAPLRSAVANFSSQIMNWLSGAAVSEAERKRLESFLPTLYDDRKTLESKIQSYRDFVRSNGQAWRDVYGDHAPFGRMKSFGGVNSESKDKPNEKGKVYIFNPATGKLDPEEG